MNSKFKLASLFMALLISSSQIIVLSEGATLITVILYVPDTVMERSDFENYVDIFKNDYGEEDHIDQLDIQAVYGGTQSDELSKRISSAISTLDCVILLDVSNVPITYSDDMWINKSTEQIGLSSESDENRALYKTVGMFVVDLTNLVFSGDYEVEAGNFHYYGYPYTNADPPELELAPTPKPAPYTPNVPNTPKSTPKITPDVPPEIPFDNLEEVADSEEPEVIQEVEEEATGNSQQQESEERTSSGWSLLSMLMSIIAVVESIILIFWKKGQGRERS